MDSAAQQGLGIGKYHPKTQRYIQLLDELKALHLKKSHDYGRDDDPFSNIRASSDFGIRPVVGALLRMNDKVRRLQVWATKGELMNESADDSMRDIAAYALIALVELEAERDEQAKEATHRSRADG